MTVIPEVRYRWHEEQVIGKGYPAIIDVDVARYLGACLVRIEDADQDAWRRAPSASFAEATVR